MSVANVRHSAAPRPRPATTVAARTAAAPTMLLPVLLASGLAALAAAALLAVALVPAEAHAARAPRVDRDFAAERGPIAVEVRVGARTTPLFLAANRPDRWYLEAKQGAKYEIRVRNTSGQRVGFVLAVDGLNAIDGRLSRNAPDEPMYVLDPYQASTIKGWRKSLDQVSRFVFVDEQRSYAERTGQGNGDLGWIRVTAFREVQRGGVIRWRSDDGRELRGESGANERRDGDAPARELQKDAAPPAAEGAPQSPRSWGSTKSQYRDSAPTPAPTAEANPGTGWGPNQRDHVRTVDFEPQRYAAAQVILRYEYKPALVALGILPWRSPDRDRTWERENGLYGFAQPPRDR